MPPSFFLLMIGQIAADALECKPSLFPVGEIQKALLGKLQQWLGSIPQLKMHRHLGAPLLNGPGEGKGCRGRAAANVDNFNARKILPLKPTSKLCAPFKWHELSCDVGQMKRPVIG